MEPTTLYVVLLDPAATPAGSPEYAYGPFPARDLAEQFAAFLTAEVDPATVHELRDPATELLNFWIQQRNNWHPGINITTTASDEEV